MIALLAALAACAPAGDADDEPLPEPSAAAGKQAPAPRDSLLPETDMPYAGEGAWRLGEVTLTLADTTLRADGSVVLEHVYHAPLAGPDVLWVPAAPGVEDGAIHALTAEDGELRVTTLVRGGMPDRLVPAPDGATLLYVAGHTGLTSVWAVSTTGGQPRQITNQGLEKPIGRAPEGFVPPWEGALPTFSGDRVRWQARGSDWEAAWR